MTITITRLYQLLVEKTDKETAETLTTYIDGKINKDIENKITSLATKEDIANLRSETKEAIANVHTEIANVRTEIAKAKTEMIRWYVTLFVMLTLMIAGLYLKK